MAISFPPLPLISQLYTYDGVTYIWTGSEWKVYVLKNTNNSFNKVQIEGREQFDAFGYRYINFQGINLNIFSADTNTLIFSAQQMTDSVISVTESNNSVVVVKGDNTSTTFTIDAITGGSYSNGVITFSGSGNVNGIQISGFSSASSFTGGTVNGSTNFTNGLTANTISVIDPYTNFSIVGNIFGQTSLISSTGAIVLTPGIYGVQINGAFPDLKVNGNIIADGNLGVGTTSPSYKLDVNGDGRFNGGLTVTGTTSSPTFTGNSDTMSGTKGSIVNNGSTTTAFISVSGSNTVGGTGYTDFIRVTNTAAGATNPIKTIRINNTGAIEFLNSAYSALTFTISDNGIVTITSPASVTSNSATNNALNVGTKGQLFDDGNFHIHSSSGSVWINALDGSAIRLGTQTNSGNSTVLVDTSTVGHSFFTKVQSGFNVAFGTEITMDNLKVRINGTGGSGGLVQGGAVSGSFAAYTTLVGNVAGAAIQGDTNSAGITFTTTYQNISGGQKTLSAGGDTTTLHLIDTTNSRIYRITAIHCQDTTGGYTSIERMA